MFKFLLFLLFFSQNLLAQSQSVVNENGYNYWINLPKNYEQQKPQPLIVFLHGRSLSGTDINRVKRYGILKAVEKGVDIPAIIVAPQLPSGPWDPKKIKLLIDDIEKQFDIDKNKIYILGMSLGGYGTSSCVAAYPELFAAAVAICGGGQVNEACALTQTPIKYIHGDKDAIVPIKESEKMVDAIKKCDKNAPVFFKIIPNGTHGSVEDIFRHIEIYNWLFKFSK